MIKILYGVRAIPLADVPDAHPLVVVYYNNNTNSKNNYPKVATVVE